MRYLITLALLALPLAALAQQASNAPMLIVTGGSVVTTATAPANATTEDAIPEAVDTNKMAASLPANAITNTTKKLPAGTAEAAPSPASISKQWPRDTMQIFMKSCVGLHPELIDPCNCVITRVMEQMTHDEFMRLTNAGTMSEDPRFLKIQNQCATQPQQRK